MRLLNFVAISFCALTSAGCGPSLQQAPTVPRSLAGHWIADASACQEIDARLQAALNSAQEKEFSNARRRAIRHSDRDQLLSEPHGEPDSWEVREQHEQYQALFEAIRPAAELEIAQEQGQIQFSSNHAAKRTFEIGTNSVLVTTFAHLRIQSGWQNDEFVVYSKDGTSGIDVMERYRIRSDGSLLMAVTMSVKYMQTQQYTLVYHKSRAT